MLSLIMGHHDYAECCRVRHHRAGIFHGYNCFRTDGCPRHCQKDLLPFGYDADLIVEGLEVDIKILGVHQHFYSPALGIFLKKPPLFQAKAVYFILHGQGATDEPGCSPLVVFLQDGDILLNPAGDLPNPGNGLHLPGYLLGRPDHVKIIVGEVVFRVESRLGAVQVVICGGHGDVNGNAHRDHRRHCQELTFGALDRAP